MKLEAIPIGTFEYLSVTYDASELNHVLRDAKALSQVVNAKDPSGSTRRGDLLYSKNLGGLISEKLVGDLLRLTASSFGSTALVLGATWTKLNADDYQIDHVVVRNDRRYSIETRSSFSYKTFSVNRVVSGAFSIVGPYSTQQKSHESIKDFYAFAFFYQEPLALLNSALMGEVKIYFAGGATREMMLDNKVSESSNLGMKGAAYRVIRPITRALDANTFLKTVLGITI